MLELPVSPLGQYDAAGLSGALEPVGTILELLLGSMNEFDEGAGVDEAISETVEGMAEDEADDEISTELEAELKIVEDTTLLDSVEERIDDEIGVLLKS